MKNYPQTKRVRHGKRKPGGRRAVISLLGFVSLPAQASARVAECRTLDIESISGVQLEIEMGFEGVDSQVVLLVESMDGEVHTEVLGRSGFDDFAPYSSGYYVVEFAVPMKGIRSISLRSEGKVIEPILFDVEAGDSWDINEVTVYANRAAGKGEGGRPVGSRERFSFSHPLD